MNSKIEGLLEKHGLNVSLKGYKEMESTDGHHMKGTLYINNKKAILFEDMGFGGGCDFEILNPENAKPLTDIEAEMKEIKAYPESETISDIPYMFENLFYEMAEDFLVLKDLKKYTKTKTLIKWGNEEYGKGEFGYISRIFNKNVLQYIFEKMEEKEIETIELFNLETRWKTYSINDLKTAHQSL